jgi:hypothetical protein
VATDIHSRRESTDGPAENAEQEPAAKHSIINLYMFPQSRALISNFLPSFFFFKLRAGKVSISNLHY